MTLPQMTLLLRREKNDGGRADIAVKHEEILNWLLQLCQHIDGFLGQVSSKNRSNRSQLGSRTRKETPITLSLAIVIFIGILKLT